MAGLLVAVGALADGISESATSSPASAPTAPVAPDGPQAAAPGPEARGASPPKARPSGVQVRGGRVAEARAGLSVGTSADGAPHRRRSARLTRKAQVNAPVVTLGPDGKIRLRLNAKVKLRASRLDVNINARNLRADADLTLDLDAPTISAQP